LCDGGSRNVLWTVIKLICGVRGDSLQCGAVELGIE
jgi:hypothetical protein